MSAATFARAGRSKAPGSRTESDSFGSIEIPVDALCCGPLLRDAMTSFATHCVQGLSADTVRMGELLQRSLMLVTALTPHIGYDRAARTAKHAHVHGTSLREAAVASGDVAAPNFDAWVCPAAMARRASP